MSGAAIMNFLAGFANVLAVLAVAPLFEGMVRKLTARVQSRQGPPLWQPYFDLLKLLGKEDIEAGELPWMQRAAAYLSLASVLLVAWLIPGFMSQGGLAGDAILLVYLLTLCGISTLFAGLAAGSTYSLLGISREMMTMIALEPLFALAIVIGTVHTRSFRLETILNGSPYGSGALPVSGLLMLVVMVLSFQAYVQRVPFDTSEAETELMEGPLMEYSGPKLALFKWAQMCKLVIYGGLFVGLFAPWGHGLPAPWNGAVFAVKVFLVVVGVTWVAATHARYRIDQVLKYYARLLLAALVALIIALYGY